MEENQGVVLPVETKVEKLRMQVQAMTGLLLNMQEERTRERAQQDTTSLRSETAKLAQQLALLTTKQTAMLYTPLCAPIMVKDREVVNETPKKQTMEEMLQEIIKGRTKKVEKLEIEVAPMTKDPEEAMQCNAVTLSCKTSKPDESEKEGENDKGKGPIGVDVERAPCNLQVNSSPSHDGNTSNPPFPQDLVQKKVDVKYELKQGEEKCNLIGVFDSKVDDATPLPLFSNELITSCDESFNFALDVNSSIGEEKDVVDEKRGHDLLSHDLRTCEKDLKLLPEHLKYHSTLLEP